MQKKMKDCVESIHMPQDMRHRITQACKDKTKALPMFQKRRFVVAAASLLLCLSIPIVAGAAGKLGNMRDVTNWCGAITGQVYEQATDSILVTADVEGTSLLVTAELLFPDERPFPYIEQLNIKEYRILDLSGKTILKGEDSEDSPLIGHKAVMVLPISGLPGGSYTLKITSFEANAKAEQPLPLMGDWEQSFQIS